MIWTTLLALAAASLPLSTAKPLDVWSPKVLEPSWITQWYAGGHYNVTWDTTHPPSEITNAIGKIYLYQNAKILTNLGPLASDFNLHAGHVKVSVPLVQTGNYKIVLFGDSGNLSDEFEIIFTE